MKSFVEYQILANRSPARRIDPPVSENRCLSSLMDDIIRFPLFVAALAHSGPRALSSAQAPKDLRYAARERRLSRLAPSDLTPLITTGCIGPMKINALALL